MKSTEKMIDGERKHTCLYKWKNDGSLSDLASLVASMVNNLPAMQEIQVQSPGQEDPLEKGMATHSSILAWRTCDLL